MADETKRDDDDHFRALASYGRLSKMTKANPDDPAIRAAQGDATDKLKPMLALLDAKKDRAS